LKAFVGGASILAPRLLASSSKPAIFVSRSARRRSQVKYPKHFYPVDCNQCHVVPAATGAVTTGAAYQSAWVFPHTRSKMTNPSTCVMCHTNGIPN
jgi:hypothetical protein